MQQARHRTITLTPEIEEALQFALGFAYEDQRDYLRNFGIGDTQEDLRIGTALRKARRYRVLASLELGKEDWLGLAEEVERLAQTPKRQLSC